MGTISEYMQREQIDPTEPDEFYVPCASDTPDERRKRREAIRHRNRIARYGEDILPPDDLSLGLNFETEDDNDH